MLQGMLGMKSLTGVQKDLTSESWPNFTKAMHGCGGEEFSTNFMLKAENE